jgi:hypothetical protein
MYRYQDRSAILAFGDYFKDTSVYKVQASKPENIRDRKFHLQPDSFHRFAYSQLFIVLCLRQNWNEKQLWSLHPIHKQEAR